MSSVKVQRSQAILRMPVDMVEVELILHDGDRAPALLLVHPAEDLGRYLCEGPAFVAVIRGATETLVARDAVACFGIPAARVRTPAHDDGLPHESQRVVMRLRSGIPLEGELRWVAPPGQRRTSDHLNADARHVEVYAGDTVYLVRKDHIAQVTER